MCLTLCEPMDCSLPDSSVHGIFQARVLEWVAFSSSRNLPDPRIKPSFPVPPALAGRFFTTEPPVRYICIYISIHLGYIYIYMYICVYAAVAAAATKSLQSCPTLCDHIDSSPPGSPVPGILQARTLEWVAISFSRGPYQPKNQIHVSSTGRQIPYHKPRGKTTCVYYVCAYTHIHICTYTHICRSVCCRAKTNTIL